MTNNSKHGWPYRVMNANSILGHMRARGVCIAAAARRAKPEEIFGWVIKERDGWASYLLTSRRRRGWEGRLLATGFDSMQDAAALCWAEYQAQPDEEPVPVPVPVKRRPPPIGALGAFDFGSL